MNKVFFSSRYGNYLLCYICFINENVFKFMLTCFLLFSIQVSYIAHSELEIFAFVKAHTMNEKCISNIFFEQIVVVFSSFEWFFTLLLMVNNCL